MKVYIENYSHLQSFNENLSHRAKVYWELRAEQRCNVCLGSADLVGDEHAQVNIGVNPLLQIPLSVHLSALPV